MDNADSKLLGLARGRDGRGPTVNDNPPGIHPVHTGQYLDERGFSCAVLAYQRVHFSGP
jgi:hypothetical protein